MDRSERAAHVRSLCLADCAGELARRCWPAATRRTPAPPAAIAEEHLQRRLPATEHLRRCGRREKAGAAPPGFGEKSAAAPVPYVAEKPATDLQQPSSVIRGRLTFRTTGRGCRFRRSRIRPPTKPRLGKSLRRRKTIDRGGKQAFGILDLPRRQAGCEGKLARRRTFACCATLRFQLLRRGTAGG